MRTHREFRAVVRPVCLVVALALAVLASSAAQTAATAGVARTAEAVRPSISKVEPPNWWTNFSPSLMVLLYGDHLNGANISVKYPGVTVDKVQTEPDGLHAFVWLKLDSTAKPGTLAIHVKGEGGEATANLALQARSSPEGKFQGVTPNDVIYLIMPDRFADGDPSNDQPPSAAPGTYNRNSPMAYHGGDLKGIQQHLPYLKDLGITTLWLTPLYLNYNGSSD